MGTLHPGSASQTRWLRAAITEARAASAFQEALAPDLLLKNVDFAMPEENGETDVLVRIDDVLLGVEAKSGVLSDAAYGRRKSALTKRPAQAARKERSADFQTAARARRRTVGQFRGSRDARTDRR